MKRWIIPILCALAAHTIMFRLELASVSPMFTIPESRAVTISLVDQPPAPVVEKIVTPVKKRTPPPVERQPLPEPPAKPKKIEPVPPSPEPQPIPEAQPQVDPVASVSQPKTAPSDLKPESKASNTPQDQALVQASVPIYHLNPRPIYPTVARRRNYQGTVVLNVLVDRHGSVSDVTVDQSCGYVMLDRSALKSVRQWRFEPGKRLGRAIEMWVKVPVRFKLE